MATNQPLQVKFRGPANVEYDTLEKASLEYLDNCSENWKNYENPKSFIFPPIFNYMNADLSDERLQELGAAMAVTCPDEKVAEKRPGVDEMHEKPVVPEKKPRLAKATVGATPKLQEETEQMEMSSTKPKKQTSEKNVIDNLNKHRTSDNAEYFVFRAIEQLIQDQIQAPFIAIHNLDLQSNLDENKSILKKVFQCLNWDDIQKELARCSGNEKTGNAEFDFVLIGPKIGLIVIEVKSAKFASKKDFQEKKKGSPQRYAEGLKQLKQVDVLFHDILGKYTGLKMPENAVRKIIFLSNLESNRYKAWKDSLLENEMPFTPANSENIIHWYSDDIDNKEEKEKPPLYETFRNLLDPSKKNKNKQTDTEDNIPMENREEKEVLKKPMIDLEILTKLYETYAPILAAIRAVVLCEDKTKIIYDLNELRLSHLKADEFLAAKILAQNPLAEELTRLQIFEENRASDTSRMQENRKAKKPTHGSGYVVSSNATSVMFLNQEQLKALAGCCRQLLIGSAGTGKTVVIQEKARQLMADGKSVIVLAPICFMKKYETFFAQYENDKQQKLYEVKEWSLKIIYELMAKLLSSIIKYTLFKDTNLEVLGQIFEMHLSKHQRELIWGSFVFLLLQENNRIEIKKNLQENFPALIAVCRLAAKELKRLDLFHKEASIGQAVNLISYVLDKLGFHKKLLGALEAKDWDGVIVELLKSEYAQNTKQLVEYTPNDLITICNFIEQMVKSGTLHKAFFEIFPWFEKNHVFIDDLLDDDAGNMRHPEAFIVAIVLFMEMAKQIGPKKVLWAGMDAFPGRFLQEGGKIFDKVKSHLESVSLNESGEQKRFGITTMNKVLRCTENIAKLIYGDETWAKLPDDLRGRPGHKIIGSALSIEKKPFFKASEARKALLEKTTNTVQYLLDHKFDLRKFAIVVGTRRRRDNTFHEYLAEGLKNHEEIHWPGMTIACEPNEANEPGKAPTLQIYRWDQVSSLEWPIVLYVACTPKESRPFKSDYKDYSKYRAVTRAIGKLFYFDYTFEKDDCIYDSGDSDNDESEHHHDNREFVDMELD